MTGLFRRAGVDKTSVIRVTGRGGLATVLWLCRRGYEQVGYVRHGPCPTDRCGFRVEEPVHGRHRDLHFARRDSALAWKRAA